MNLRTAIAETFLDEGVSHLFTLMGDGNMDWSADLATYDGVTVIHARHEHGAVAMADGYARATGELGVASVTHGPGVTQLGTALAVAARNRTPMVIFVGDTAIDAAYHPQDFDVGPFVTATGAQVVEVTTVGQALTDVRRAFNMARLSPGPVVLSVPVDLQDFEIGDEFEELLPPKLTPQLRPMPPHPHAVSEVAEHLEHAERPIIVAGRGAVVAGAREAILALAERTGALLATSLEAFGFFEGHPANLGLAGGYTPRDTRELFAQADVVMAVGARLGRFTTDGGKLFGDAMRIQIDVDPVGYVEGIQVADHYLRADAALGVTALDDELRQRGVENRTGLRTPDVLEAVARGPRPDLEFHAPALEPDTLDPREVAATLDALIDADALIVLACGHFWNFMISAFSGRGADAYLMAYQFAAIGQGLATAIGVAVARPDKRVILVEGDGSYIMNSQEMETVARHDVPLLSVIFNDGAFGAEVHKMSAHRGDGSPAIFGRANLAAVAQAWGFDGLVVRELSELEVPLKAFIANGRPALIDIHTSTTVISESYRRLHHGE